MSVVVVDHDGSTIGGAPLAKSLHATIETVEGGHRLGRLVPFGPELMGEDHAAAALSALCPPGIWFVHCVTHMPSRRMPMRRTFAS